MTGGYRNVGEYRNTLLCLFASFSFISVVTFIFSLHFIRLVIVDVNNCKQDTIIDNETFVTL